MAVEPELSWPAEPGFALSLPTQSWVRPVIFSQQEPLIVPRDLWRISYTLEDDLSCRCPQQSLKGTGYSRGPIQIMILKTEDGSVSKALALQP